MNSCRKWEPGFQHVPTPCQLTGITSCIWASLRPGPCSFLWSVISVSPAKEQEHCVLSKSTENFIAWLCGRRGPLVHSVSLKGLEIRWCCTDVWGVQSQYPINPVNKWLQSNTVQTNGRKLNSGACGHRLCLWGFCSRKHSMFTLSLLDEALFENLDFFECSVHITVCAASPVTPRRSSVWCQISRVSLPISHPFLRLCLLTNNCPRVRGSIAFSNWTFVLVPAHLQCRQWPLCQPMEIQDIPRATAQPGAEGDVTWQPSDLSLSLSLVWNWL